MKIIFLDRDGVINKYPGDRDYVKNLKEFKFIPRSLKALKRLTENKFKIFIVSNQAGVKKHIFTQKNLNAITKGMLEKIMASGGRIEKVFYCTHLEADNCICRKPNIGLILKAFKKLKLRPKAGKTFFIGDSILDVKTGKNAHLKTILVLSGKAKLKDRNLWEETPDYISRDLLDAVKIVIHENSNPTRLSRNRP